MNESVSKMWGYLLLVLMMIISVFLFFIQFDRTIEDNITDKTMEFVNECQVTGKISATNYNIFAKSIYRMGKYEITMTHKSVKAYPTSTGEAMTDYFAHDNKEILDIMFPTAGTENVDYEMKNGDILTVTVRRHGTTSTNMIQSIFGIDFRDRLVVRYTGAIGNSNVD